MTSLRGEHLIDFETIQDTSSLFAITGETGSGKSTILNCIGLCLYGQMFKKNMNQNDLVTMGEKEGSVELIFQVKGRYYLSEWKASVRKQNGEPYATPRTPTRSLYSLEFGHFNSPKEFSKTTAEELLNLSFDQFCKCIVLNQGEFAKFLTSSFSERKEILEKLYPGELLESVGKELKSELDHLKNSQHEIGIRLLELMGDMHDGSDLKARKEELEKKLIFYETQNTEMDQTIKHLKKALEAKDKFNHHDIQKNLLQDEILLTAKELAILQKNGQVLEDQFLSVKKEQEENLPILQESLKKEESLHQYEKNAKALSEKINQLILIQQKITLSIQDKEQQENDWETKILSKKLLIPISPEDLRPLIEFIDPLVDSFSEKEILVQELKEKNERQELLIKSENEYKLFLIKTEDDLKKIPANILTLEKEAEEEKNEICKKLIKKEKADFQHNELLNLVTSLEKELKEFLQKEQILCEKIALNDSEISALESFLKIQELMGAKQLSINYALHEGIDHCPVCESPVAQDQWRNIKEKIDKTDLQNIRKKHDELNTSLIRDRHEKDLISHQVIRISTDLVQKKEEMVQILRMKDLPVPSLKEAEEKLQSLKKDNWIRDELIRALNLNKEGQNKTLGQLNDLQIQIQNIKNKIIEKDQTLIESGEKVKNIIPDLNLQSIKNLKSTYKLFREHEELKKHQSTVIQEKKFLLEKCLFHQNEISLSQKDFDLLTLEIHKIKNDLISITGQESAMILIEKLNARFKQFFEKRNYHKEEEQKKNSKLREANLHLNFLEKTLNDLKNEFSEEASLYHHLMKNYPEKEKYLEEKQLQIDFNFPKDQMSLTLNSLTKDHETYKDLTHRARMDFATISAQLNQWEKIQDKIQHLEAQKKTIELQLNRKLRLQEVLGKDDLRNFVLSLVEENLIFQTNVELNKLCQGRYEIIHHSKNMGLVPEFFILDKFRDGGKRKINTLSGGETFMVSLAMALGLSEMTRGQAEIDSLFIDEGFGSLDEESLGDVLDMLQQIQTRGLMIGLISHIKNLTSALSVNLVLHKKNDGTSTVSIRYN